MYLLIYLTPYNSINILYQQEAEAQERVVSSTTITLPPLAYKQNYKGLWDQIYSEILLSLDVKGPVKTLVCAEESNFWFDKVIQSKNIKVISAKEALAVCNVPIIHIGEQNIYSGDNINKWFSFKESAENIDNSLQNRYLFGPKSVESIWEKSLEEALVREKIYSKFNSLDNNFLKSIEEFYISGEAFCNYKNLSELLLMVLDSINEQGFWTFHFDDKLLLNPLLPLFLEEKENVVECVLQYPFLSAAHIFTAPSLSQVNILFEDRKEQILSVKKEGVYLIPSVGKEEITVKMKLGKTSYDKKLSPSELGIVFDTRKRPLQLSHSRAERLKIRETLRKQLSSWKG